MALSKTRVCVLPEFQNLCQPKKRKCFYGCSLGFCLNAKCPESSRHETVYHRPEFDEETNFYREYQEHAASMQNIRERKALLASDKKQMGILKSEEENKDPFYQNVEESGGGREMKKKEPRKSMRGPVRPSCMLDFLTIEPTLDELSELSLFTRTTIMPGYSRQDTISETSDSHNMAVWNHHKDSTSHVHKVKRDWLSVWGELNIKEQRVKKAWQEKILEDSLKK